MSKISIAGATTGTGTFTLASPATDTDRVLTLPDEAGTVLTSASNLAGVTGVGKVLQVVQSAKFSGVSTTSGSTQFSSSTPFITPTAASNKLLLLWSTSVQIDVDNDSQGHNNGFVRFEYQIGGTGGAWSLLEQAYIPARGANAAFTHACQVISPSTTSAVYFRIGIGKVEGTRVIQINDAWGSNSLTMMEIAG